MRDKMSKMDKMKSKYLWEGLDLAHFDVLEILPMNSKDAVIIMKDKRTACMPWCLQYRGTGHYFTSVDEMENYIDERRYRIKSAMKGY